MNPLDLPTSKNGTNDGFFEQEDILDRVPWMLQTMSVTYACFLALGTICLLSKRPPGQVDKSNRFKIVRMNGITHYVSTLSCLLTA